MNPTAPSKHSNILKQRQDWLNDYRFSLRVSEIGRVESVGDGIAWISGLPSAAIDDILAFEDGSQAVVLTLNQHNLGAVLLKQTEQLTAGTIVHRTAHALDVPAGDGLLGRMVDPMGEPLDGLGPLTDISAYLPMERPSPPIIARDFVNRPLYTGIKAIDTLIPIGKGQRQLIIGDEGLGRSSIALDAVINQRGKNVICVYVLIGQKRSAAIQTIQILRDFGAMGYTTVVVAESSELPGLQYLAPFAGCAMAEGWMNRGRDTLIVYDDLSTHAKKYRELSLLLRRPPGREAYPGDIFSVHARLLERSTCLNAQHGGSSMTALPIVETLEGEIAAYIPTNLISITDGQIYLEQKLFAGGFRPAIDIGRSVSRIGGQAQHPKIKAEAGRMKLDYLQFLELESFTRFGAKLEASMALAIKRGHCLRSLLKQERLSPISAECQLAWLIAFNERLFDHIDEEALANTLNKLFNTIKTSDLSLDSDRKQWLTVVQGVCEHA